MGLWRFDRLTRRGNQVTQGFLASSDVRSAFSAQGRLALGGSGGVTVVDQGEGPDLAAGSWRQMDRLFNLDLAAYTITCLAFDRRNLFVGTERGLIRLGQGDDYASIIGTYEGLRDQDIRCLCLDGDSLWIGTAQGPALYIISAGNVAATWPELDRFQVRGAAAAGGRAYLATDRGAVVLEGADSLRPRWLEDPAAPELARELEAVVFDGRVLWWLAPEALLGLEAGTGKWRRFMAAGNYLAGRGRCLAADSLNVWVGTEAGLARYFRDLDRWCVYHPEDGLMDDQVWAVCSQDGWLWAGGPRGASRFRWAKQ
jgi:ligand-binding sensor domain-containing protein